ncbi:MAG: IS1634 family transposase, partial [Egibacteraceae bacterium]
PTPVWDFFVALFFLACLFPFSAPPLSFPDSLAHIHERGGRFVTVLPHGRTEDTWFRDWICEHTPRWVEAQRLPGRCLGDAVQVWRAWESPLGSEHGFRIIWIHNNTKAARDAAARHDRIMRGVAALEALAAKLAGPRCRYKDPVALEAVARRALGDAGASRWLDVTVTQTTDAGYRQENRGRPGKNTRYVKVANPRLGLDWRVRDDIVAHDAASDGCFPLLTNDTALSPADTLAAYRYQPNLENRHHGLKGAPIEIAPVWLNDPARIEGLACAGYLALLIHALIERQLRAAMATRGIRQLPIYPEDRASKAPTTTRVFDLFDGAARHHLICDGDIVRTYQPDLTPLQRQVLDLLDIPTSVYTTRPTRS